VKKVDFSLKDKIVKLDIEDSANLKDDVIEKVLKESGYQVEKIER
jgi:copper chaperone CopZ